MKKILGTFAGLGSLLLLASTLSAQIVIRQFDVYGTNSVVEERPFTRVLVTADVDANTYTINFSNTFVGTGGYVGTITSFGFNTPFTNAQLGTNGSNVSFTSTKPVGGQPNWHIFEPYGLSQGGGIFAQEIGVGVGNVPEGGNPGNGIHFGETATFVFTFPDFSSADGFFDSLTDFTVRWQQVGSVNVAEGQRGGSDFGGANDSPIPSPAPVPTPVPEPSTYGIIAALALLGFAAKRRFFK